MTHVIIAVAPVAIHADPASAFADHRARIEILRPMNKAAIFDALSAAAVTHVEVTFNSYGDSGQVEAIAARSGVKTAPLPEGGVSIMCPAWGCAHVETRAMPLAVALEHLVYDCLSEAHPGWEKRDGAVGTFTFEVAARTITLEHNNRNIAVKSTTQRF